MSKINLMKSDSLLFGPFCKTVYVVNPDRPTFLARLLEYLEPIYKTIMIQKEHKEDSRFFDAQHVLLILCENEKNRSLLYVLLERSVYCNNGQKNAQQSQYTVQKELLATQYDLLGLQKICAQISAYWKGKAELSVELDTQHNFLFTFTPH